MVQPDTSEFEVPDSIVRREDPNSVDQFLNAPEAPTYKNDGETETKRKQEAMKSISYAFQYNKYGGKQEVDWEQHKHDYEAIVLDYALSSKDLAYHLRLTLKDQLLAFHKSEYPRYAKTCQMISLLKGRFDTNNKRETNLKALSPLKFQHFIRDSLGSSQKTFNALVLRVENFERSPPPIGRRIKLR